MTPRKTSQDFTAKGNLIGALLMMGAMAAYTANDTVVKLGASDIPLFQLLFLRGVPVTLLLFALAYLRGELIALPKGQGGRLGLRVLTEIGAFVPFVIALTMMPLANLVAILQALPLTVTLAGALFLGEAVGWRRWSAICIGLIGVLLIVQPGLEGFNVYALLGLLAVAMVTVRDIVTRTLSADVPSVYVAALTAAGVTGTGLIGSLFSPWVALSLMQMGLIAAASMFILCGYLLSVMTMRHGEISFVTPFRYTAMIWGLLLGWLVFGDWPNDLTLLGAAIVVLSGIYTILRGRSKS